MNIRLCSWNVNGIRASIKKGFWDVFEELKPDVIGIQETKTDGEKMIPIVDSFVDKGLDIKFHGATMRKGYSGVATVSKVDNIGVVAGHHPDPLLGPHPSLPLRGEGEKLNFCSFGEGGQLIFGGEERGIPLVIEDVQIGLGNEKFDEEGRLVTVKYKVKDSDLGFTLINGYYPQGGRGQDRIDYKIEFYKEVFELVQDLRSKGEKVILCGDFNTTFTDIDLARPKENQKKTGCLPEEREVLKLFTDNGFVDSYRHFYPEKEGVYTFWDQKTRARDRNVGWRIDYFLIDEKLLPNLKNAYIWGDVMGSDHCPIGVDFKV